MPVRWTPENDRILLLKLIETHAISVNYQLIANAWPAGDEKPTAKALSERFSRLRKIAGIPLAKGGSGGRTSVARAPRTPLSSAKKRKITKKVDSDESDADEHLTPSEDSDAPIPTPSRKTAPARTPKTPRFGDRFANDPIPAGFTNGSPSGVKVKKEAAENPFESNDFAESLSNASSLRARVNRQPFESSAYGFNQYGVTTPGGSGHESSHSHSENGMDGAQDLMSFNTFGGATGMSDGMGMEMGYSSNHIGDFNDMGLGGSYGMAAMPGSFTNTMSSNGLSFSAEQEMPTPSKALADDASRLHLNPTHPFAHHGHTLSDTRKKPNPRLQVPSKPSPARRTIDISESQYSIEQEQERMQRTPRGASQSAKQNISQRIEAQKQLDMEDGEKSSEEDSATSEFQGDDDEYV